MSKINLKNIFLIAAAFSLCASYVSWGQNLSAQSSNGVDLKSLLREGLDKNYDLQIVRLDEENAEENAKFLNSGHLPTLDVDGDYNYSLDNNFIDDQAAVDRRYKYTDDGQNMSLGVGLSWTLFDGFSVRTNYARNKELEQQSKVQTRIMVEDYIAELAAEYYNYIKQQNSLRILKQAVELSRERLRITEARYVVGNFSRLDYRQAQVYFNTDSASYIKQHAFVKSASIKLKEMVVREQLDKELIVRDSVIHLDTALDYDNMLNAMQNNNAELLFAEHNTTLAQLDLQSVMARNYPYIELEGGYGYSQNRNMEPLELRTHTLGFDAGVNLEFKLFDPARRGAKRNAQRDLEKAHFAREGVELRLSAQFNDLWQAYLNNQRLLHLEKNNLGAARETYEIARERYMLGNLSGIELREAQKSLLDAEERIVSATYDTKVCEISLMLMSGEISKYL